MKISKFLELYDQASKMLYQTYTGGLVFLEELKYFSLDHQSKIVDQYGSISKSLREYVIRRYLHITDPDEFFEVDPATAEEIDEEEFQEYYQDGLQLKSEQHEGVLATLIALHQFDYNFSQETPMRNQMLPEIATLATYWEEQYQKTIGKLYQRQDKKKLDIQRRKARKEKWKRQNNILYTDEYILE